MATTTTRQDLIDVKEKWETKDFSEAFSPAARNVPLAGGVSGSRINLVTAQMLQVIPIDEPDVPYIVTGHENINANHAQSSLRIDHSIEVVSVVDKYPEDYGVTHKAVIFRYLEGPNAGMYDMTIMQDYYKTSSGFAYPIKYKHHVTAGTKISSGSPNSPHYMYRASSIDEHGNYMYGKNLNYCLVSIGETKEDAGRISRSGCEKLAYTYVSENEIVVTPSNILLNKYGDVNQYKCFPDIGQEVDREVGITRKVTNEDYDFIMMQNMSSRTIYGDTIHKGAGRVIDIEIYSNDLESISENPNTSQIYHYYQIHKAYTERLAAAIKAIIRHPVTPILEQTFRRCSQYADNNSSFHNSRGAIAGTLIKIITAERVVPYTGHKLTDRFGNKGIACHMCEDDEMPINEFGVRADIKCSPLAVPARGTISQLYVMFYNSCSNQIIYELIKENASSEVCKERLLKYISMVNAEQGEALRKDKHIDEIIDEIMKSEDRCIHLVIPSFPEDEYSLRKAVEIINTFKIRQVPVTMQREIHGHKLTIPSVKPVEIAMKYTLLLRHTPDGKYSVRSTAAIDKQGTPVSFKGGPTVSNPHTGVSPKPIKASELATYNLLSTIKANMVNLFYSIGSFNLPLRQLLIKSLVEGDPYSTPNLLKEHGEEKINKLLRTKNIAAEKIKELFRAIGLLFESRTRYKNSGRKPRTK